MPIDKKILIQTLNQKFNEGELRTLAFDLNINLEDLPSGGKADIANEIVEFADRRGRLEDLAAYVTRLRSTEDQAMTDGQVTINANIGNVGISGNISVGQSIHSGQIAGGNMRVKGSQQEDEDIHKIRHLLVNLRDSLDILLEEMPEERELRYALENVEQLQAEMKQPDPRPKFRLLYHQLKDNDYILDTVRSRKSRSGNYAVEAVKASNINKELIQLTRKLSQTM